MERLLSQISENEVQVYRRQFPMLASRVHGKSLVYLDTAATAQKPECVIEAETRFYREEYATVHRAVYSLSQEASGRYQQVRERVARFIGAESSDEVVFTRGTTDSINLVAGSYGRSRVAAGDAIVISEIEHHANIVPWQMLCKERGAELRVCPVDDAGVLDLAALEAMLCNRTKMVAIAAVSNALGTIHPIRRICELAHGVGAVVLVDGAQAVAHDVVDVRDWDCDFFAFSGHKLYGPTGVGVLYGKAELLEQMPPYQGGGDMIETVTFAETTYNAPPLRFEAGTPMTAQVMGLGAAVEYLSDIGLQRIGERESKLLCYASEGLSKVEGVRIIGAAEDKGAILSFVVDGVHPLDIGTLLDLEGVAVRTGHHCAQPAMRRFGVTATVRASFSFLNTFDEIDMFLEALRRVLSQLSL